MILALKLLLTPCLIAAATLSGRRWGPGVSGWLIGFPLTSAPVSVLLYLQHGPLFASQSAAGTLAGQASVCAFCLAYSTAARRWCWPASAGLGLLVFLLSTLVWTCFSLALLPVFAMVMVVIAVVARLMPRQVAPSVMIAPPAWDLPARMAVAAVFVVSLTTFAGAFGPQLSGLLSPLPIFGTVLAVFTHRAQGGAAAGQLLRGIVLGSGGFAVFFLVVGALLPGVSAIWTYLLATLAALLVNGFALRLIRR